MRQNHSFQVCAAASGIVLVAMLASAVHGQTGGAPEGKPVITITSTPPASVTPGPDSWGTIEGTAGGVNFAECKVVIYAYGDMWYVQPYTASPYTKIGADGHWRNGTHGGFEYAAMLVKSSYQPPSTLDALPEVGGDVLAIAKAKPKQE